MTDRTRRWPGCAGVAVGLLITLGTTDAMNLNLAMPWDDKCSPPQEPKLVFYSRQSDDLLFDRRAWRWLDERLGLAARRKEKP